MRFRILLIFLTGYYFAEASIADNDTVRIRSGLISGTTQNGIHIYKGIPFAAPPVGTNRWREPQPVQPWQGVRACEKFAASPMQGPPAPFGVYTSEFLIPPTPISEDCLYLNVWSSQSPSSGKKPVLVWIYGGGFVSGGSGCAIYDGAAMAAKGIVFVSINYRVGVFGFFAHPDLTKESSQHASGNYGLLDQIAALRWVQDNIAAFGGDPRQVTIAGQSAGSMSVNCLVASPLAKGLFRSAIAESGALFLPSFGRSPATLMQAEKAGMDFGQSLKAASIEALRNLPASSLLSKAYSFRSPIVDGWVLPTGIDEIFASGRQNHVNLLTGWNENDGSVFGSGRTADDYKKQLQTQYKNNDAEILKWYPADNDSIALISQARLSRDLIFGAQGYYWALQQISAGDTGVYVYRFARRMPASADFRKYGAFHTAEVPYAYGNLGSVNRPFEQSDYGLEIQMLSYWSNFVKTGNPNGEGTPEWPAFSTTGTAIQILDAKPHPVSLPDKQALDHLIVILKGK